MAWSTGLTPLVGRAFTVPAPKVPRVGHLSAGDPVGAGIVCSLAHPRGNGAGLSNPAEVINGNRLQLVKELLDGSGHQLSRVAILRDANNSASQGPPGPNMSAAATILGLWPLPPTILAQVSKVVP